MEAPCNATEQVTVSILGIVDVTSKYIVIVYELSQEYLMLYNILKLVFLKDILWFKIINSLSLLYVRAYL